MAFKQQLLDLWALLLDMGGWTLVALAALSILTVATALVSIVQIWLLQPYSYRSGAAKDLRYHIEKRMKAGQPNPRSKRVPQLLCVASCVRRARASDCLN